MTKVFVFGIGPVEAKGAAVLGLAAVPASEQVPIVTAESWSAAFEQMARALAGCEVTCAPELEAEGRKLGFEVGEWTPELAMSVAAASFEIASAPQLGSLQIRRLVDDYLRAAAELWRAPMRQDWSSRDLIWFGCRGQVLGNDVDIVGEAILMPDPARAVIFYDRAAGPYLTALSRREPPPPTDHIVVSFDEGPAYAREALQRALDLPVVPRVVYFRQGQVVPLSDATLALCTGVLQCMKFVDARDSEKRIEIETEIEPEGRSRLRTWMLLGPELVLDEKARLMTPGTEMILEVERESLDATTTRIRLRFNGQVLSVGGVLTLCRLDEEFRSRLIAVLAQAPFEAFFWETPPIATATLEGPFELVLIDAPELARAAPEPGAFHEHFASDADGDGIVVFENLGRDATLVVPRPVSATANYAHLAAFLRTAPPEQADAFLRCLGTEVFARVSERPLWLSTAGMGIYWLHARLDTQPKYYRHAPYKAAPGR